MSERHGILPKRLRKKKEKETYKKKRLDNDHIVGTYNKWKKNKDGYQDQDD
jgi:hypothetical protein